MPTLHRTENTRAVAPVIGFLLVTAILIIAAVQYQNNVVPAQQLDTETDHFQQVGKQLAGVQSGIIKSSSTGKIQSQSVQSGIEYQVPGITRPPIQGSMITIDAGEDIKIKNGENNREATNYWSGNGQAKTYPMTFLEYNIDYTRLNTHPTIGYEYGLLYSNFSKGQPGPTDNTYILRNDQPIVNGRTINLYTTTGDVTVASSTSSTVQMRPVSAPTNTITLTDNGSEANPNRVKITLPTQIPERVWRNRILDDQIDDPNGCRFDDSTTCETDEGFVAGINSSSDNSITIVMEKGRTYNLRMSRIHLTTRLSADEVPETDAQYVAWRGAEGINIKEGETITIQSQARDKYNNGVLGQRVIAEAAYVSNNQCAGDFTVQADDVLPNCENTNNNIQPGEELSGDEGYAYFVYTAPQTKQDREISFSLYLRE